MNIEELKRDRYLCKGRKVYDDTVVDMLLSELAAARELLAQPPNVCPNCGMFLGLLQAIRNQL